MSFKKLFPGMTSILPTIVSSENFSGITPEVSIIRAAIRRADALTAVVATLTAAERPAAKGSYSLKVKT